MAGLSNLRRLVRSRKIATIPDDPYDIELMPEFMRGTASVLCLPAGPREDWACHAERVVTELGIGGLPVRTQQLKMQIRCSINAGLDSSIATGSMAGIEALQLTTERGFQELAQAEEKWRRARLTSTRLSACLLGTASPRSSSRSWPRSPRTTTS
jgi:hypothetical protein